MNRIGPKNTVEDIKHLKIQHLFDNPKNTAALTSTQKNTDFRNSKPKKYSANPCMYICRVHPLGGRHVIYHPNFDLEFEIHTDTCRKGIRALLGQTIEGRLRPIRYLSKAFTENESKWQAQHQKLSAIKYALEAFRPYVTGHRIKIETDNASLQFLHSVKSQQAKLARWCLAMSEFDFYIEHRPGKQNVFLSRNPLPASNVADTLCYQTQ